MVGGPLMYWHSLIRHFDLALPTLLQFGEVMDLLVPTSAQFV